MVRRLSDCQAEKPDFEPCLIQRGRGTGPTKPGNPRSRHRLVDEQAGANSDSAPRAFWKMRSDDRPRRVLSGEPLFLPVWNTLPDCYLRTDRRSPIQKASQRSCAPSTIKTTPYG